VETLVGIEHNATASCSDIIDVVLSDWFLLCEMPFPHCAEYTGDCIIPAHAIVMGRKTAEWSAHINRNAKQHVKIIKLMCLIRQNDDNERSSYNAPLVKHLRWPPQMSSWVTYPGEN